MDNVRKKKTLYGFTIIINQCQLRKTRRLMNNEVGCAIFMTVSLSVSPGEIATWRDGLAVREHWFSPLRGSSHILVIAMHTCHYSQNTLQLLLDLPRNLGPLRVRVFYVFHSCFSDECYSNLLDVRTFFA